MTRFPSRVVFENQHYSVCYTRAGLTVQSLKKGNGKLIPLGKIADHWLDAFDTALDTAESHALARAIYLQLV